MRVKLSCLNRAPEPEAGEAACKASPMVDGRRCWSSDAELGQSYATERQRLEEEEAHRRAREAARTVGHSHRHLREWINHGSYRRFVPGANVIKIQHPLHSPGLHAPNDRFGVAAEQGCSFTCSERGERNQNTFKMYIRAR